MQSFIPSRKEKYRHEDRAIARDERKGCLASEQHATATQ